MTVRIGLDIGATKTLGVVVDAESRVVDEVRIPTRRGPDGVVATAVEVVRTLDTDHAPQRIGVGVPGLVDSFAGAVKHAVNLDLDGEWFPLGERLAGELGVPVFVENDVNVAALGVGWALNAPDLAYLSIGTGLAAGLVLNGALRRGAHGAAGEIGHAPVDPRGALCQCGQRGCLETLASGSALSAAWPTTGESPAAVEIFGAAASGDARAIEVRDQFAAALAEAVRMLALTVDPELIVIGGGVSALGEPLRVAVADALRRQAAGSDFLASLDLAGRVQVAPADAPLAAVGAALLGGGR